MQLVNIDYPWQIRSNRLQRIRFELWRGQCRRRLREVYGGFEFHTMEGSIEISVT